MSGPIISTMSMQAEETLRDSIDELWDDVIIPHIFHANENVPLRGGTDVHILNESLSRMKANFYTMMISHYEPTIEEVINNTFLDDTDDDTDDEH